VEWMTDEMERRGVEILDHLLELGDGSILEGVYEGIDNGWFVGGIADSAYRFEREVNEGTRTIVGVNAFTDGDDSERNLLRIDQDTEDLQLKRLAAVKQSRDSEAAHLSLEAIKVAAADPAANLVPPVIDAVKTYATEGEICDALAEVLGRYVEQAIV
ncbi:MAG: methylmalonyl-CoA mutase family protein, partial [Acidimicrobiaceae bacterium]|nr:methylmalonyl-CoA mutase family protein [Acidimicrobiaceae bacterium]